MKSITPIPFAAAAALLFASTAALAQTPILELEAVGDLQIDPDGHVHEYHLANKLSAAVTTLVETNVRKWQFEPVLVNGVPVRAKTAMHLYLSAVSQDKGYVLQVDNIIFGEPTFSKTNVLPHFPDAAVKVGMGAKVLLSMRLDSNGQVADAQIYQTSLGAHVVEKEAGQWRALFEEATLAAARTWRFDLSETINGHRLGTSVQVPITFNLTRKGSSTTGVWNAYIPGPVHSPTWLNEAQVTDTRDLASLKDGEARPMESHFRLKADVIGKAL
jgi:TonB family protein